MQNYWNSMILIYEKQMSFCLYGKILSLSLSLSVILFSQFLIFTQTLLFIMVSEPTIYANNSSSKVASSAIGLSSMAPETVLINLMNQPLLLLSNMSNMMIVKLDNTNYIVWKHQITMVLETYSMFELLDETQLVPDKFQKIFQGTSLL